LFLGTYPTTAGASKPATLISEQVSHHPPITAYHIATPYNIALTGHNGADLAFKSGSIVVKQTGHAQLTLTLPNDQTETYYITLPDLKIQGLLTFTPYVELDRTTYIYSSTGYLATIKYAGAGWLSGQKNSFTATLGKGERVVYKISGQWTGESHSTSIDHPAQKDVPFWNAKTHSPTHIVVAPRPEQSAWESRRVWKHVAEAIDRNDVETAGRYKSAIEIGQRKMRDEETREGTPWKQRFFRWEAEDRVAGELRAEMGALTGGGGGGSGTVGSWKFGPDEEDQKAIADGSLFNSA
jgi:oxysterol-binding protein-related protein 9/10/11